MKGNVQAKATADLAFPRSKTVGIRLTPSVEREYVPVLRQTSRTGGPLNKLSAFVKPFLPRFGRWSSGSQSLKSHSASMEFNSGRWQTVKPRSRS